MNQNTNNQNRIFNNNSIGSRTSQPKQPEAPISTFPMSNSIPINLVSFMETRDLTVTPTETTDGVWWTPCGRYRGNGTTSEEPPMVPLLFNQDNSNSMKRVFGFNVNGLTGSGRLATNNVVSFSFNAFIIRNLRCIDDDTSTDEYNYYLELIPFAQPGSKSFSYLYDSIQSQSSRINNFKAKPNTNYRLILISTSGNRSIADSAILSNRNSIDSCKCATKLRILSNALINGWVGKQISPPVVVQYQALINIRSSTQKNSPYNIQSFSRASNNPYPYEYTQTSTNYLVAGDVIGENIIMRLVQTTAEVDNLGNAASHDLPLVLKFGYLLRQNGTDLELSCQYVNNGDEPPGFIEQMLNGFEKTEIINSYGWTGGENPITLNNNVPIFSTPVKLSEVPYNPNQPASAGISLMVQIPIEN